MIWVLAFFVVAAAVISSRAFTDLVAGAALIGLLVAVLQLNVSMILTSIVLLVVCVFLMERQEQWR